MIRFAVVTDIHYGFNQGRKVGAKAPSLVDRFVRVANKKKADFAVDLGDRIINTNSRTDLLKELNLNSPKELDLHFLKELKEQFNRLSMPKYSVHGNHDLGHLTRQGNAEVLKVPGDSYSLNIKGFHLVFWNPEVRLNNDKLLTATADDLAWLRSDLKQQSKLPTILFSHIPLDNEGQEGMPSAETGWYFPSFYTQGPEIREILEKAPSRVLLCMAGHRHRNQHREINGIHYITHQSLTQRSKTTRHPHGAFSIVDIDKDVIQIKGYGSGQPDRILPLASGRGPG
jgi:hypothetical protein